MYSTVLNVAYLGTLLGGCMAISLFAFLYNNIIMAQAQGNFNKSYTSPSKRGLNGLPRGKEKT